MSTCSTGDVFQVDALVDYDGVSLSGCYENTGETSFSAIVHSLDGGVDRNVVYAPNLPVVFACKGIASQHPVWALGIQRYDDYYGFTEIIACVDAGHQHASTLHPTEVGEWDCFDSNDGTPAKPVTTRCGCNTPGPASASRSLRASQSTPPPTPGSVPAAAQTSDHNDSSDGDEGVSVGVIVGSAVGGALVVCILVVVILFKIGRLKTGTRVTSVSPDAA